MAAGISRSEAIRRLIELGLKAAAGQIEKSGP
jgi:hypothetical protein